METRRRRHKTRNEKSTDDTQAVNMSMCLPDEDV
jgi:hypothetical protein